MTPETCSCEEGAHLHKLFNGASNYVVNGGRNKLKCPFN